MTPHRRTSQVARIKSMLAAGLLCAAAGRVAPIVETCHADPPAGPYRIERLASPIRVDGTLNEAGWQTALKIDLIYEIMPGENIPPPVETECRLGYDSENLYVAFVARDPRPHEIRARLSDRDSSEGDDQVGLMLDTFHDGRRAFEFFVNPLGVQTDIFRNDLAQEESEDASWDAIWNSAGRLTGDGYVVEIAIPFTALRFPRTTEEQSWGFSAFRNYPRSQRHQIAGNTYDRNRDCVICQYPTLTGLSGIHPGRNLELDPTFTARRHSALLSPERTPPGGTGARWQDDGFRTDFGLTTRWAMTPNLIVNATANPDFSQVEADAAQLDVNTRYALFYAERRPFFLEGADFFATQLQAVHTRTVADPDWGLKLTGKEKGHAIGVFVTRDAENNVYFPSNAGTAFGAFSGNVTNGVFRYRRDVKEGSTVGGLVTIRESGRYHNRVGGVDGHLRFADSEVIRFQGLESSTRYPHDPAGVHPGATTTRDDFAGHLQYEHSSRNWNWSAAYQDLGPGFRADAGFIPRVDIRHATAAATRVHWGQPGASISQAELGIDLEWSADHHGTRTDQLAALRAEIYGPRMLALRPRLERKMERYAGRDHQLNWALLRFSTNPSGSFSLWGVVAGGDGIDYANARKVRHQWGGPGFYCSLGRRFQFYVDHTYDLLNLEGRRIYSANLLQGRAIYQLSARSYLRVVGQLTDTDFNPKMYLAAMPTGRAEALVQFLGSYKVNPQTVLYLGYSDLRTGRHPPDLRVVDRTLFLKLGYAWLI